MLDISPVVRVLLSHPTEGEVGPEPVRVAGGSEALQPASLVVSPPLSLPHNHGGTTVVTPARNKHIVVYESIKLLIKDFVMMSLSP